MKVFDVVFERDGMTKKSPEEISTDLLQQSALYAAEDIESVLNEIQWLRQDPEVRILAVREVAPSISIVQKKS